MSVKSKFWDNYIEKYISENATPASIRKADNLISFLEDNRTISNAEQEFTYSCVGDIGKEYQITINIQLNSISNMYCSCPYDQDGICKHTVASLQELSTDILDFPPTLPIAKTTVPLPKRIPLENGILNEDDFLSNMPNLFSFSEYVYSVSIEQQNAIQTVLKTHGSKLNTVSLTYNKEEDIISTICTCKNKAQECCLHVYKSIEHIIELFGVDYFSEDFLNNYIADYIEEYDLTLDDNYKDIFEFTITPEGVKVHEKIKNFFSVNDIHEYSQGLIAEFNSVTDNIKVAKDKYGLGFVVINTRVKNFGYLQPVWGKCNANSDELKSSFKSIDNYFNFSIDDLSAEDQLQITKAINVRKNLDRFISSEEKATLIKYLNGQNDLLTSVQFQNVFLLNKAQNSIIKKNLIDLVVNTDSTVKLQFKFDAKDGFLKLKASLLIDGQKYATNSTKVKIGIGFVIVENILYPINNATLMLDIMRFNKDPEMNFLEKDLTEVFHNILKFFASNYEIDSSIIKKNKQEIDTDQIEKQVYIKDTVGDEMELIPVIKYPNDNLVRITAPSLLYTIDKEKSKITYQDRSQMIEDEFLETFCSLHPNFDITQERFYLPPEALMKDYWLLHTTEILKRNNIKFLGASELKSFKFNPNKANISIAVNSGIDWFEVAVEISFGNQKVTLKDVQKAFLKRNNYVALDDGTIGILPEEWMKKFGNYFKTAELKKDKLHISNYQFGIIDELYNELETKPDFLISLYETKQRLQKLENNLEFVEVPKGIKATLRPYQEYGFNWMLFLHKNQLGGCLADDMGLGKTLQAITFLQHLKVVEKSKKPSIIIAPTSLVFNWNQEIEKFCPSLKVLIYTGSERKRLMTNFNTHDIIITTYGVVINDVEELQSIDFNYIILDESQAIKNPSSKRYKAVRLLKAFNRLVLTGTPIENNTFDLYAQFNFVNPGLLGNISHFKSTFSDAIDKEKDEKSSELLAKIVHPFLLRRTKEKVALDLPEKTESIIYCEMSVEQRKVYDTFKNKYRDYILNKIDENGIEKSQMFILEGLMKLRQICNTTAILNEEEDYGDFSIKLDTLTQIIKEKTGKHKILIFSQFVKMLQLVKSRLDELNIKYEYLDGQNKNRHENVSNFQQNDDVRIFLISLKAGGTGLNLTEADYVFILDPWWNPAVENQAIDRCYRIGQQKNVMAYRMICKDTIEEKIVDLQQRKKSVANSIIQVDGESKSFNLNEVKDLFM